MTTNASNSTVRISATELHQLTLADPEVRVIDVRTSGEFEAGHIPGAYNVPLDTLHEHGNEIAHLSHPAVLVCQSGARAAKAEEALRRAGMANVRLLEGGMNAWISAQGEVRVTKERWSLERQVRLVAGVVVLTSIVVSIWVPAARFVAGFLGAGLTFAALTNTCAMGMALAKLPYNRGASCDIGAVIDEMRLSGSSAAR